MVLSLFEVLYGQFYYTYIIDIGCPINKNDHITQDPDTCMACYPSCVCVGT